MINLRCPPTVLAIMICLAAMFGSGLNGATPVDQADDQAGQSAAAIEPALDESSLSRFSAWADDYLKARSASARAAAERPGKDLAVRRRAALLHLIKTDPERALHFQVSKETKDRLPRSVAENVEEHVSGRGDFLVLGVLPEPGREKEVAPIRRVAVIGGKPYEAHVFGARLHQRSRKNEMMNGIAIGNEIALEESAPEEPQAYSGGTGMGPQGAAAASATSLGPKRLLFIRARFADQGAEPATLAQAQSQMAATASFFRENSNNQTDLLTTFPPTFVLPQTTAWYTAHGDVYVQGDARNAALAAGYDYQTYDLDAVRFNGGPGNYAGQANIGAPGCWLKSSDSYVSSHEFGHNYGLWHANFWNTTNDSVYGAGTSVEYGDSFDTMGLTGGPQHHFNAWYKQVLSWIPAADFLTTSVSGTYRIFAHDSATASGPRGLRVPKNLEKNYGVEFRQKFTANNWLMSGAGIRFIRDYNGGDGSQLLDTTSSALSNKNDSAIAIGRTFSDVTSGIHITPIGKGGTVPQSLDVVVNLGTFPGNQPPAMSAISASKTNPAVNAAATFSVTGSDPNGDSLAYGWDFGDGSFGANAASVTKSWPAAGEYNVRCVLSDMKGGQTSKWIIVRVGSPNTLRAIGRVLTNSGVPLEGARMTGGTKDAFTDSAGNFTILQLLRNQSYTFTATKYDRTMVAGGFINPVRLKTANVTNINFTGTPRSYTLTGRATDQDTPVAGVTISDGTHPAVTTDANGNFTIPNVANGSYTLTATKPGYEWYGGGVYNQFEIEGADRYVGFLRWLYPVNGIIYGTTQVVLVGVGDGLHQGPSRLLGGTNRYGFSVPNGTWTVRGTLAGSTVSPRNFVNPLTLTDDTNPPRDFDTVPGIAITGTVTENGAGVADVTVTSGTMSVTTDSRGNFAFTSVANGAYDLVPSKLGYTFSPASKSVTVSGAGVTDNNFAATPAAELPLP